jgi:hypothetical protein
MRFPSAIEMIDSAIRKAIQPMFQRKAGSAVRKTRIKMANPAALEPTDRKAVTGVGAPS